MVKKAACMEEKWAKLHIYLTIYVLVHFAVPRATDFVAGII